TTATKFISIANPPAAPDASPAIEADPLAAYSSQSSPTVGASRPSQGSSWQTAASELGRGSTNLVAGPLVIHDLALRGRYRSAVASAESGALDEAVWRQLADEL